MREEWERDFERAAQALGERKAAARSIGIHPDTVRHHERRDPEFAQRVAALCPRIRRSGFGGMLLAIALCLPAAATTITSSPVQLGSTGLTLAVTLLRWQESAPDDWTSYSNAGVTINDLGTGAYTVSGLPLASGTDRYAVTIALAGDEDRGLSTYSYGATPGVRLVWKEELDLPSAPSIFRKGDTFGSLSLVVKRNLPAAACAPGTTAEFSAGNAQTGAALFTNRAATISNCQLDNTTGTYGLTATYDIQSGDLANTGRFFGTFRICYSPSSCQSLPATNTLKWEVVPQIGG